MRLFNECPNRFLEFPRPGLPVRALFYGPEQFSVPAARAVCKLFGYTLIDVKYITQIYEDEDKRSYVSAVVNSAVSTAKLILASKIDDRPDKRKLAVLRNAIGDWIQLYFGYQVEFLDVDGADGDWRSCEVFDNYSGD